MRLSFDGEARPRPVACFRGVLGGRAPSTSGFPSDKLEDSRDSSELESEDSLLCERLSERLSEFVGLLSPWSSSESPSLGHGFSLCLSPTGISRSALPPCAIRPLFIVELRVERALVWRTGDGAARGNASRANRSSSASSSESDLSDLAHLPSSLPDPLVPIFSPESPEFTGVSSSLSESDQ